MSKALSVIFGLGCVFLLLVVIGGAVFTAAAPDQVIHALNGKTLAEYSNLEAALNDTQAALDTATTDLGTKKTRITELEGVVDDLNGQISGYQKELDKWKNLLCKETWAQATNQNNVFYLNAISGVLVRPTLNELGFEVIVTQWTSSFDPNKPFDVLLQDLRGGIILNVTDHCLVMKKAM